MEGQGIGEAPPPKHRVIAPPIAGFAKGPGAKAQQGAVGRICAMGAPRTLSLLRPDAGENKQRRVTLERLDA